MRQYKILLTADLAQRQAALDAIDFDPYSDDAVEM